MMNQRKQIVSAAGAALVLVLGGPLASCEKKAPPPKAAPTVSSAPAPKPRATLDGVKLGPKVEFPEDRLPTSQEAVHAIVTLANAITGASPDLLSSMITARDNAVLDMLIQQGEWQKQIDATKVLRVCVVNEPSANVFQVGLGVQDQIGAFISAWEATASGDKWVFSNMAIEPRLASTAEELDGAELKVMALPTGKPVPETGLAPTEQKNKDENAKEKPKPGSDGGLPFKKDKF